MSGESFGGRARCMGHLLCVSWGVLWMQSGRLRIYSCGTPGLVAFLRIASRAPLGALLLVV